MKTVFQNSEVAHIWAQNNQKEGRNSANNIYFRNGEIFSYGSHFCMGKILQNGIVLLTNRTYSNTTAKHLSFVRYAVNHKETVYCAYPERSINENLKAFQSDMECLYEILNNSKKRQNTKENAIAQLVCIANNIDKYLSAMGADFTSFSAQRNEGFEEIDLFYAYARQQDLNILNNQFERIEGERAERKRLQTEKAAKEAKERRIKWLKGENVSIWNENHIYLRAKDEIIETSKGAKVEIKAAKVLFERILQGKDVKGFEIGHYTVIGLNGVLTIGCHKIERKEINRLAKKLGWGQIPVK
jgi:hypothetical protein